LERRGCRGIEFQESQKGFVLVKPSGIDLFYINSKKNALPSFDFIAVLLCNALTLPLGLA
jgi:hypothetical protein